MAHGCVPILLSDAFEPAYATWLDYRSLARRLPERCLAPSGTVGDELAALAARAATLVRRREAEWEGMAAAVSRAAPLFSYEVGEGGRAAEAILTSLVFAMGLGHEE